MPQSLGALGGKPNNAYYFIGFLGKKRGITSKSLWVKGGWAEVCMGDQAIPVMGPCPAGRCCGLWSAHSVSGLILGEQHFCAPDGERVLLQCLNFLPS